MTGAVAPRDRTPSIVQHPALKMSLHRRQAPSCVPQAEECSQPSGCGPRTLQVAASAGSAWQHYALERFAELARPHRQSSADSAPLLRLPSGGEATVAYKTMLAVLYWEVDNGAEQAGEDRASDLTGSCAAVYPGGLHCVCSQERMQWERRPPLGVLPLVILAGDWSCCADQKQTRHAHGMKLTIAERGMLQHTASRTATTLRLCAVQHVAGHPKLPNASQIACITHCTAKQLILTKCMIHYVVLQAITVCQCMQHNVIACRCKAWCAL